VLQSLHIKNLALLEELSLDFEAGFTAVTGETGAGKSILLGALSLLAGERADKTMVRQGATLCEVEASLYFSDSNAIDTLLDELELPRCEEGLLLLKRSVPTDKAPKITINGSLATLAALQKLGSRWIDFHGPGEPRRLLRGECQLDLLDLFGKTSKELTAYTDSYLLWREKKADRERIAGEENLTSDQIDFLREQVAKMDAVELTPEAIDTLERDMARMSRSQELLELTQSLALGLIGDEGLQSRLAGLVRDARRLESIDTSSKVLADRLSSLSIELTELGAEFTTLGSELNFDPEQIEALQSKMNTWLDLKRKHGGSLTLVKAARETMRKRLEAQGDVVGTLARLDKEIQAAEATLKKHGSLLATRRKKAAEELSKATAKAIVQLGFAKAEFKIHVFDLPTPGPKGDTSCEFLFSPNVGEEARALAKVASSGELARVMLALKSILAEIDDVPLLVFDEVDANVGGEIGRVVGEKMAKIGATRQVLCVTHLPQVAAQGTCHLVVTKDQTKQRAVVTIAPIQASRKARISELARMLGDRNAKSALAHAEELLKI